MSGMANGKKRSFRELADDEYQEKPLKLVMREYDDDEDNDDDDDEDDFDGSDDAEHYEVK